MVRHAQMPKNAIKTLRSQKLQRYKVNFVHMASYLYIDNVSLGGCGQACLGIPKKAFKTLISQKLMGV